MIALPVSPTSTPAVADWLDQSGLSDIELALARVRRRSATRLIDVLFMAGAFFRAPLILASLKKQATAWLRPVDWEMERYLSGASDCIELEHRMREWERRQRRF